MGETPKTALHRCRSVFLVFCLIMFDQLSSIYGLWPRYANGFESQYFEYNTSIDLWWKTLCKIHPGDETLEEWSLIPRVLTKGALSALRIKFATGRTSFMHSLPTIKATL
ncbi:hypothetical protein [Moorena producens]|uniref:hypothetical protein n=1 Tax=Moorena producens TaxID=1155739 RepID=UPI003C741B97